MSPNENTSLYGFVEAEYWSNNEWQIINKVVVIKYWRGKQLQSKSVDLCVWVSGMGGNPRNYFEMHWKKLKRNPFETLKYEWLSKRRSLRVSIKRLKGQGPYKS